MKDVNVISAHFPDAADAKRVRRAAERLGMSPSALLREAALKHVAALEKKCPTCGARHAA